PHHRPPERRTRPAHPGRARPPLPRRRVHPPHRGARPRAVRAGRHRQRPATGPAVSRVVPATEPPTAAVDTGRVALVVTAVATVAVDVVTKIWASAVLADGGINLPGPLDLQLAHNRGVAFSLFGGAPAPVMIGLTSAVTVVLAVAAWRGMFPTVPAGVILGGAVANLADRMV